jgi:hypothetical protein
MTAHDQGGGTRQPPITCPRCDAVLVGVGTSPDAAGRVRPDDARRLNDHQLYGAQQPPYRSSYAVDAEGRALLSFRRHDGTVRTYPVLWRWRDPISGVVYPWMIDLAILEKTDLEYITGLGRHAFNAVSANLPGRIPGRYTVACRADDFVRDYIFGDLVRRKWTRMARSAKRRQHHPTCPPNCRKAHR